ncbi:hypothetical protein J5N97_004134 [Dioscorea zingiberensis]|uniref:RING/U-box superfamily protein n=1 Tax=Dioscorea zingiberensis TaxID=325984 RepID=A0A9D5D7U7_9LILI|nr:hypothetical protein J5N97_004134 [Dioscorea zingiberensis]
MPHFQGEEEINNGEARAPPVAFLVRSAVRMSRARWFSFLRGVFRYQNGPRSDLMSNPFNSMSWILFEFIVLMVQMLVITFVMVISRHEKPVWPLRIWIAGYNLGNLLSMPLLYCRYRCSSVVVSRGSDAAASNIEQQRRNNNGDESRSSSHVMVMMNKSRTFLELFFAIWFVMGNVWIFDTRYRSFAEAPRLHGLCIALLAWNAIGYSFPFLLFLLLCCFVPLLSRVVGFNMNSASEGRGASDDQISQLPQWKYKDIVDVELANIHHHHQNTECCICLAKYSDKEEVEVNIANINQAKEGGEGTTVSHSYIVEPMSDHELPVEGGEDNDGSQGMDVGRVDFVAEENEEDEDLTEDPDFRESDEEVEDVKEDLFFSAPNSDAYESELRAWMGRELDGTDHGISDQDSEYDNPEILRSLCEIQMASLLVSK